MFDNISPELTPNDRLLTGNAYQTAGINEPRAEQVVFIAATIMG
jgi:hypothetical protein